MISLRTETQNESHKESRWIQTNPYKNDFGMEKWQESERDLPSVKSAWNV